MWQVVVYRAEMAPPKKTGKSIDKQLDVQIDIRLDKQIVRDN